MFSNTTLTYCFESTSKSTFGSRYSFAHHIAWYNPRASPTSTEHIRENHNVLAHTSCPSLSRIDIPIPHLFIEVEKEASILHFTLPRLGFCHPADCGLHCRWQRDNICVHSLLRHLSFSVGSPMSFHQMLFSFNNIVIILTLLFS